MKQKILGFVLIFIGLAMFSVSTALMVAANVNENGEEYHSEDNSAAKEISVIGKYYLDGNADGDCVVVDDETISLNDEAARNYSLTVWHNIAQTNELTGKITLVDHYFLQLDEEKIPYDDEAKSLVLDGKTFIKI